MVRSPAFAEKARNTVGIPVLKAIPVLGQLFRSTVEKKKKTETIVFLTPKIVTGEEPFLRKPEIEKKMRFRTRTAGEIKQKIAAGEMPGEDVE